MNHIKKIFKNMSWFLVSQIITGFCGFIWTILIARYLGVSDYGILGFAVSLTSILAITMDLGISTHVIRHIATDYDSAPKYFGNIIPLKSIFAIGTSILTAIILIVINANELTIIVTLLLTIEMIFKSFISFFYGFFQAFEEGKYLGITNTLLNTLLLFFILIAIFTDKGIIGIVISYILANLIAFTYVYSALKKYITRPKFEFDKTFCKQITLASIPFAIGAILYSIYYSIDMLMLTNIVGSYASGIYNASYKLVTVLNIFYSVYSAFIFPVMSKLYKNNKSMLLVSFEKSIKYLMFIMIPLSIGTVCYSGDIINLIYGPEYSAASSVLSILIWTVCLLFISGACNLLLNSSHKEVTVTKIYAIAAVFNIILNLFMIHYLSYNGAAITTVLSELLIIVIQSYVIYNLGHRLNKKLYLDLIKIIFASIFMGSILMLFNINLWLAIPLSIIIYFTIILILKVYDSDDNYIIKEIIRRN